VYQIQDFLGGPVVQSQALITTINKVISNMEKLQKYIHIKEVTVLPHLQGDICIQDLFGILLKYDQN
jgi:hypothetical protein